MANPKRRLTPDEVKELLSLKEENIDAQLLRDYFAAHLGREARFNTYDEFLLPPNTLFNKQAIETTIGRYIINLFCFPKTYLKKKGYMNTTLTKSAMGKIDGEIARMLLDDEMSVEEYTNFLNNIEWFSMGTAYYISPTMDFDINKPIPEIQKLKDKLFDENREGIQNGDAATCDKIEKELLSKSKEILKKGGNEGFDFFESGNFNFENNYKKTAVLGGVVKDTFTGKLSVIKSSYMEGIDKKEVAPLSNLTVLGGYSRGVETMNGGYETKKVNNATQSIVLDEPGSDCGTKFFLKIKITDGLKDIFIDRYISDGGKLVLLTKTNIDNYVNKTVLMRSPLYCKGDKICSKCAGELFYKLGIKNAGLITSTFSGSIMNLNMKAMHDASIKYKDINIEDFIKEV